MVEQKNNEPAKSRNFSARRLKSPFKRKKQSIVFIIIFAAIGAYLLFHSLAAGNFVSQELESGVITAPATTVTDTTASGSSAVAFSSSTGGATSCPSTTTVPIQTSDNAQSIVNAHTAGTVYLIKTGIHSGFSVSPHAGDTYCGESGTILDGGGSTQFAFNGGGAGNVTIIGASGTALMEIRNYRPGSSATDFKGAIENDGSKTPNWLVRYTDIHNNFPVGLTVGNGTQIRDNKIHDNTTLGISSGGNSNITIDHNEFYGNNSSLGVSCDFEAGGVKISVGNHIVYNNNYSHDNGCDGLWNDLGVHLSNPNASFNQITNNILVHNGGSSHGSGEHYEISGGPCTISGNYAKGNNYDGGTGNFYDGGQIYISNSFGCDIFNNTVVGSEGIILVDDTRSECTNAECPANNNNIHDNNFYFNGIGLMAGGDCADSSTCGLMNNGTNKWQNNHYHMPNTSASVFNWPNTSIDKTKWQSYGFDTTSTFDTNTTAPAQPAWSLSSGGGGGSTFGSVRATVNAPAAGNYVVWSRIMVPSTSNQSYGLSIDGGATINVGGSGITPNTWTWVNYQNGSASSTITANLTAGSHTLTFTGTQASVKIDRALLLTDTTCTPTGTGDNCVTTPPPTDLPPTVSVAASPTTVTQGQSVNLQATANDTDSTPVAKVDFYNNGNLIGTDSTSPFSPYSVTWNTTTSTVTGAHNITAKATDTAGLSTTSSPVTVTVNAAQPPVTQPIPSTIEAESYKNGGEGVGYHDTTAGNLGGACRTDDVDIKLNSDPAGGNCVIGWFEKGEWLAYDVNVLSAGTYTVTARVARQDTPDSSFHVEIDGTNVSGSIAVPTTGAWTTFTTVTKSGIVLPAGVHVMKIVNDTDFFDFNWVSFATNSDTTLPTVSLTAPASGSTVSGTAVALSANATDNAGVASVTFSVDGTTVGSPDTTSPYSVNWNSTTVTNGSHTIMAKAIDASGNQANSQYAVNVSNADTTKPSTPTNLTATAPAYNKVNLSWLASTDNVGVTGYYIVRNGVTIAQTTGTGTTYSDTTVSASTNSSYYVFARDAAGNVSANSNTVSITTPVAPTAPSAPTNLTASAVSDSQINLTWTASSGNPASYDIYRKVSSATTYAKVASVTAANTSYGDTGLAAITTYNYYVVAVNSVGSSPPSSTVSATTLDVPPPPITGIIQGTVRQTNGTPLNGVRITSVYNGSTHTYFTNTLGQYIIRDLPAQTYTLTFVDRPYRNQTVNVVLAAGQTITKDVVMTKNK